MTADHYAIGFVQVDQDIKYPGTFYIRGETQTITGTGAIASTVTGNRINGSFSNPTFTFTLSGTTSTVRMGATITVDKKGQGNWLFN